MLARNIPRLTLLALACLEHAAALDPAVRAEVERRAAELIPPRSPEEARELVKAGPLVLELLPGPEGLSDSDAWGVTVTASLLGAEEPEGALAVLLRFRDHPSLRVRRQLVGTWGRFDSERYATEVLDHLDRDDLHITCETPEQRATLSLMRPWHKVSFIGSVPVPDMVRALDPGRVETLSLEANDSVGDLSRLLVFSSLKSLWLQRCPHVSGLATLCLAAPDDPLTAADWQQVAALPALRALVMYAPFSVSTYALDVMPELPAVAELRIPGNIRGHSLATLAARLPSVRKVTVKAYGVTLDLTEYTRHFPDADIGDDLG
ncbi:hypothetical protein AB0I51_35755 [Streptomyces sp. NPDC050549]|uniref:hypothetical protein n=1 Tax=Streptomyces sp. NPDC050549 TaxID=3155406 RepID=UPI00344624BA